MLCTGYFVVVNLDFILFLGGGGEVGWADIIIDVLFIVIIHDSCFSSQACMECHIVMVMMVTMILLICKV